MVEFPKYLEVRQPDQFFIEEVREIARVPFIVKSSGGREDDDSEDEDTKSDLWEFMRRCNTAGYAVRSWEADHALFVEAPRPRRALEFMVAGHRMCWLASIL